MSNFNYNLSSLFRAKKKFKLIITFNLFIATLKLTTGNNTNINKTKEYLFYNILERSNKHP